MISGHHLFIDLDQRNKLTACYSFGKRHGETSAHLRSYVPYAEIGLRIRFHNVYRRHSSMQITRAMAVEITNRLGMLAELLRESVA